MDISKMTDQEKSVLLARAMGWEVADPFTRLTIFTDAREQVDLKYSSLYNPEHMALAWLVLNWAFKEHDSVLIGMSKWLLPTLSVGPVGNEQYNDMGFLQTVIMPPADAQRLWLDHALELAIEAGIIEEE